MITALDAWFDRVAGAVHAFGREVLKFIGDGVLAVLPITGAPAAACEAALCAVAAARAGTGHLDAVRQAQGCRRCPSAQHCGPAVNLVSRLEGCAGPLGRSVLISGAVAAEIAAPLGEHALRGIAAPCGVSTLPDA